MTFSWATVPSQPPVAAGGTAVDFPAATAALGQAFASGGLPEGSVGAIAVTCPGTASPAPAIVPDAFCGACCGSCCDCDLSVSRKLPVTIFGAASGITASSVSPPGPRCSCPLPPVPTVFPAGFKSAAVAELPPTDVPTCPGTGAVSFACGACGAGILSSAAVRDPDAAAPDAKDCVAVSTAPRPRAAGGAGGGDAAVGIVGGVATGALVAACGWSVDCGVGVVEAMISDWSTVSNALNSARGV